MEVTGLFKEKIFLLGDLLGLLGLGRLGSVSWEASKEALDVAGPDQVLEGLCTELLS